MFLQECRGQRQRRGGRLGGGQEVAAPLPAEFVSVVAAGGEVVVLLLQLALVVQVK